ncbi:hypothetical protein COU49_02795 [Candidatus Nomurabacteria bacterium CG10_big_fil_rev_8_21_14_0_10_35_16]|uniref:Uncharacterized protein n=1 Tax=Candidatus Nomurabacteria bacterium CG10_big_fil_rev_8_21_14_0_10_35_16 TaxID=1974731 RepID=A0A2H0TAP9_9BACT|nr:MAG: hypothetical protein COU49_02795 [Candidatus Nomurabacteria bacterium CG10_big_fil_rev_8_21_14_0_10_35_16]
MYNIKLSSTQPPLFILMYPLRVQKGSKRDEQKTGWREEGGWYERPTTRERRRTLSQTAEEVEEKGEIPMTQPSSDGSTPKISSFALRKRQEAERERAKNKEKFFPSQPLRPWRRHDRDDEFLPPPHVFPRR